MSSSIIRFQNTLYTSYYKNLNLTDVFPKKFKELKLELEEEKTRLSFPKIGPLFLSYFIPESSQWAKESREKTNVLFDRSLINFGGVQLLHYLGVYPPNTYYRSL